MPTDHPLTPLQSVESSFFSKDREMIHVREEHHALQIRRESFALEISLQHTKSRR